MRLGENTKEITQKKSPPHVEHVLTRRVILFQEAKTPSREEFRICSLQTRTHTPDTQMAVSWGHVSQKHGGRPDTHTRKCGPGCDSLIEQRV